MLWHALPFYNKLTRKAWQRLLAVQGDNFNVKKYVNFSENIV